MQDEATYTNLRDSNRWNLFQHVNIIFVLQTQHAQHVSAECHGPTARDPSGESETDVR